AVTAATNAAADQINQAVRAGRIEAGQVDDTHVAIGMDEVRIGVGDVIMTRANDARADVSNRQRWTVQSINAQGALQVADGAHRTLLSPPWVAAHVQLGYASTDYGNQGVTTDASLTWCSDATTAAGLYVGASRGRLANEVHVVAPDLEEAKACVVAAMGRDRADRGLEVARALAEAESISVQAPEAVPSPVWADPTRWRTGVELDELARHIRQNRQLAVATLVDVPVTNEASFARANEADRDAAILARAQAEHWRTRSANDTAALGETTRAMVGDYLAARDAARVIEAGPGIFGRRASRVQDATQLRAEVAQRSSPGVAAYLPGADWSDQAVEARARTWATRIIEARAANHEHEALKADLGAREVERRAQSRVTSRERAIEANRAEAERRLGVAAANQALEVEHNEAVRHRSEALALMSTVQVHDADRSREIYLLQQRSLERTARGRQVLARGPRTHGWDRGRMGLSQEQSRDHDRGIEM
ncbi:MAG: hypothetical protein ACRDWV_08265, partial [Acidimicrobiales bacterium]